MKSTTIAAVIRLLALGADEGTSGALRLKEPTALVLKASEVPPRVRTPPRAQGFNTLRGNR